MGTDAAVDQIIVDAVLALKPSIRFVTRNLTSVGDAMARAVRREPRIVPFIESYSSSISTMSDGKKEIIIDFEYSVGGDSPSNIHEVDVDLGEWDISSLFRPTEPIEKTIVTDNKVRTINKIDSYLERLTAGYENISGIQKLTSKLDTLPYSSIKLSYIHYFSKDCFTKLRSESEFEARRIWRRILSNAQVSDNVKPFLAYSYINQECEYDSDFISRYHSPGYDPEKDPPFAFISYGPLLKGRGVCSGLAWAFKCMMDVCGVPCITINGFLKDDQSVGHMWNMVKMDNGCWYHVDTGANIAGKGLSVSGLFKNDDEFSKDHIWRSFDAHTANGPGNMVDFYRKHFDSNRTAYISAGVNKRYAFPKYTV